MHDKVSVLPTAGLIVIKDNKLLLAYSNNKKAWYLPGGKIDAGESSLQALKREILEELSLSLDPTRLTYYCHISAHAYGEPPNVIMEQDCYLYQLDNDIHPAHEIGAVKYFDFEAYKLEAIQVIGVLHVFDELIKSGLLL